MNVMHKRTQEQADAAIENPFQGAIIDEDGREIPITREMIKEACHELENSRHHNALDYSAQRDKRLS